MDFAIFWIMRLTCEDLDTLDSATFERYQGGESLLMVMLTHVVQAEDSPKRSQQRIWSGQDLSLSTTEVAALQRSPEIQVCITLSAQDCQSKLY